METKLNQLLADFVVEYHKLQTFHWYVKGKDFFTEAHGEFVCSQDILKEVLKDFEYLLNEVKELKKYADDQEQYVISALMDNYISHYTKAVWMLKQQSA